MHAIYIDEKWKNIFFKWKITRIVFDIYQDKAYHHYIVIILIAAYPLY